MIFVTYITNFMHYECFNKEKKIASYLINYLVLYAIRVL